MPAAGSNPSGFLGRGGSFSFTKKRGAEEEVGSGSYCTCAAQIEWHGMWMPR
jgi:hypothetical protein